MKIDKIKIFIFTTIIFIVGIGTIFNKKETFSFYENRNLAVFPKMTVKSIFDKTFFKDFETYISDHFFQRDLLLDLNIKKDVVLSLALKTPSVNNIVIKDDILLPYFKISSETYDKNQMEEMINRLNNFNKYCKDNDIQFLYVGIPEQSSALKDEYPFYLQKFRSESNTLVKDFFKNLKKHNIQYIDMGQYLLNEPLKYYSKTDHHYNFYGAYETYLKTMEYINNNFFQVDYIKDMNIKKVDSKFLGSRNRKIFGVINSDDFLYDYEIESSIKFERYDNSNKVESTVFDENNKNVYNYYMGGDKAETIIKTNRPHLKNALIIGESFTNPLETMLYTSFNETRSLDFRHYKDKSIYEYLKEYKSDVIIYVRDDLSYINLDGNGNLK